MILPSIAEFLKVVRMLHIYKRKWRMYGCSHKVAIFYFVYYLTINSQVMCVLWAMNRKVIFLKTLCCRAVIELGYDRGPNSWKAVISAREQISQSSWIKNDYFLYLSILHISIGLACWCSQICPTRWQLFVVYMNLFISAGTVE